MNQSAVLNERLASTSPEVRKMPIGAELLASGGVSFRVWAPTARHVNVLFDSGETTVEPFLLTPEADGYHSGICLRAINGSRYRFQLDDKNQAFSDPASRFQPEGPHGPSEVIDPAAFAWTDEDWHGVKLDGQIIYEMHVGTFTSQGTWQAAIHELEELARIGITIVEMMPVADFPGRYGWGYDGVNLFAPTRLYGRPDDFKAFVNAAHAAGLAVILDVVYNHLGPEGNFLPEFSPDYFNPQIKTDWGNTMNLDGPNAGPVRELFLSNAIYWVSEFHLDGLRFDATQDLHDDSSTHLLAEFAVRTREAANGRDIVLLAENEPQETRIVRPICQKGYGFDGLWNDDFHHSAMVALTGRSEAYYSDYRGSPQEFISALKYGYLYQGQYYAWQKHPRGTFGLDLQPAAFITFLQNHDQVANTARGERPNVTASRGNYKALTAVLLLGPNTPMLFQGQEFGATTPFLYFCDLRDDVLSILKKGRAKSLAQFPSLATPEIQALLTDPADPSTFAASRLNWSERQTNAAMYKMHKDLLALRRDDCVFRHQRKGTFDGAVVGLDAFVLRSFGGEYGDRLLLVNLGRDLHLDPAPEPLLAPPAYCQWNTIWSSEHPDYGGNGTHPPNSPEGKWLIPGYSAVVLRSGEINDSRDD